MIEAVIFDLFGTLMYIAKETRPYYRLFTEMGLTDLREVLVARRVCLTAHLPDIASVVQRLCPQKRIDTVSYAAELYNEVESCMLYPETMEVLNRLKQRGIKLGCASNLATPYKKPFVRLGLSEFMPNPTFSCDEGTMKPETEMYERALSHVGVPPKNTLMVGDKFKNDVGGPLSLGINALLLDRKSESTYFARIKNLRELLTFL